MTFSEAARTLRVRLDGLTEETLKAAYAARVKALHPDTSSTPSAQAAGSLERCKAARAKLLRYLGRQTPCPHCEGTGYVV